MKKFSTVIIIAVTVLSLLAVGRNMIIKTAVERVASVMLGPKLTIGKLDIGLLSSNIAASDLHLLSPRGFKDPVMAHLSELYIRYEATTLFSGKPHLKELLIDVHEFLVVKNEKGVLNIKALNRLPSMTVDLLRLKVEKVVYKDYSGGDLNPEAHEFNINLDESYRNVSDIKSIARPIAAKIRSEMVKLIPGKIGAEVKEVVSGAAHKAADVVKKT